MNAQEFFGLEPATPGPTDRGRHWQLTVGPDLATPGGFLFGGCGLGAGLVALEAATGRPTIWATAQYLSYASIGSVVDYEVVLATEGNHVSQGRAIARSEGREILTINAAVGLPQGDVRGVWVTPPAVPPPDACQRRQLPFQFTNSILDRIEVRVAKGRMFEDLEGTPGGDSPDSAVWARVPGHLSPSAGTLAIFGDYVAGGISQALGRRTMGRSLDNTLRMVQLVPTEWVLCDIRMHAIVDGYALGNAFLWSENGVLLGTASQTLGVRFWPEDQPLEGAPPG